MSNTFGTYTLVILRSRIICKYGSAFPKISAAVSFTLKKKTNERRLMTFFKTFLSFIPTYRKGAMAIKTIYSYMQVVCSTKISNFLDVL